MSQSKTEKVTQEVLRIEFIMVSSINSFTEQNGRNIKVVIDKQEAAGRPYGDLFDSGCNLSGVSKVYISYRYDNTKGTEIERIFLEFRKPLQQSEPEVPFYHGWPPQKEHGKLTERIFDVDDNDSIVRIDVWARCESYYYVGAIQFHLESGLISQLYGVPMKRKNGQDKTPISFERKNLDSQLAGIHGHFLNNKIRNLGFTFAMAVPDVISHTPGKSDDYVPATNDSLGQLEGKVTVLEASNAKLRFDIETKDKDLAATNDSLGQLEGKLADATSTNQKLSHTQTDVARLRRMVTELVASNAMLRSVIKTKDKKQKEKKLEIEGVEALYREELGKHSKTKMKLNQLKIQYVPGCSNVRHMQPNRGEKRRGEAKSKQCHKKKKRRKSRSDDELSTLSLDGNDSEVLSDSEAGLGTDDEGAQSDVTNKQSSDDDISYKSDDATHDPILNCIVCGKAISQKNKKNTHFPGLNTKEPMLRYIKTKLSGRKANPYFNLLKAHVEKGPCALWCVAARTQQYEQLTPRTYAIRALRLFYKDKEDGYSTLTLRNARHEITIERTLTNRFQEADLILSGQKEFNHQSLIFKQTCDVLNRPLPGEMDKDQKAIFLKSFLKDSHNELKHLREKFNSIINTDNKHFRKAASNVTKAQFINELNLAMSDSKHTDIFFKKYSAPITNVPDTRTKVSDRSSSNKASTGGIPNPTSGAESVCASGERCTRNRLTFQW